MPCLLASSTIQATEQQSIAGVQNSSIKTHVRVMRSSQSKRACIMAQQVHCSLVHCMMSSY